MKTIYIDVGDGEWGVLLNFDYNISDSDDIWAICRSFGVSDRKAKEAIRILMGLNTGMAISNEDIRMSAMFISKATNSGEWWSTVTHEISHVVAAIVDYYGIDCDSEEAAYLTGFLTRRVMEEVEMA